MSDLAGKVLISSWRFSVVLMGVSFFVVTSLFALAWTVWATLYDGYPAGDFPISTAIVGVIPVVLVAVAIGLKRGSTLAFFVALVILGLGVVPVWGLRPGSLSYAFVSPALAILLLTHWSDFVGRNRARARASLEHSSPTR